jgi:hypothetical protein
LLHEGKISESISFPNTSPVSFTLAISNSDRIEAKNSNSSIYVIIPEIQAKNWIDTDQVGIFERIKLDNNQFLDLLIEKDFPCLDRPNEDKSDTFQELAKKSDNC